MSIIFNSHLIHDINILLRSLLFVSLKYLIASMASLRHARADGPPSMPACSKPFCRSMPVPEQHQQLQSLTFCNAYNMGASSS